MAKLSKAEYANKNAEVEITAIITMNGEPVATMEMTLPVKSEYEDGVTYDTDPAIEALGQIERHILPRELTIRYDEYVTNEGNEDGGK